MTGKPGALATFLRHKGNGVLTSGLLNKVHRDMGSALCLCAAALCEDDVCNAEVGAEKFAS